MPKVISAARVTGRISAFEVHAPGIAAKAGGGQIVLARFQPSAPWSPKAISGVDRERETLSLLWRDAPGVAVPVEIEVMGPYGRRKALDKASKALFVADGLGAGGLLPRVRESREAGCYTMVIAGYPSKAELFWVDRLNEMSDELYVVTDDGSYGIKGPIRQTLRAICEQMGDIDHVHAAGPLRLLKATADVTRSFDIPATVSLATVFDDADRTAPGDAGTDHPLPPPEGIDWDVSIDLDAHSTDFESLSRKLGIPLAK